MIRMTSRERVLMALNHQEPDRVPIDIGSSANNFTAGLFQALKKHFGILSPDIVPRPDESAPFYNDDLIQALGGDFRHVFIMPSQKVDYGRQPDGTVRNDWGIVKRLVNGMNQQCANPLADAQSVEDILRYDWPDPDEACRFEGIRERARMLHDQTEYAVAARAVSHGMFELAWETRGMENFLCDLAMDDDMAYAILEKITDLQIRFYTNYLRECGPYVQVVQTADDYGTQTGLMISRDMWRKFIKPQRKRLNDCIRKHAPGAKIFHHTCGSVFELIEDFIEIGIDILNPVQPYAARMDSATLKAAFGDRICFHGGIDEQRALPVSIEAIDQELRTRIHAMAPGGGYIIGPTSNIQDDTSVEHVLYYLEKAKEYGRYPITV